MKQDKVYYDGPMRSQFKKRANYDAAVKEYNKKKELEEGKYRLLKMRHQSKALQDQTRVSSK